MSMLRSLRKPFHVNFEITNRCNYNCKFCSAQLSKYYSNELSTRDVSSIIRKLVDENVYALFLTGGEPLLRKDLPIFVKQAINCGMNVCVSTNAVAANKSIAESLAHAGLDEIQVSIQAPNEIHNEIVGVDGALEAAFEGMDNLIQAGIGVIVASVGIRRNYRFLPELGRKVAKMGAICYRVLRLMPTSSEMLEELIPHNEIGLLVKNLIDLQEEGVITTDIHTPPGFFGHGYYNPGRYPYILHAFCGVCTAGKTTMAILPNGDCTPCIEFKDAGFIGGNIMKQSLSEIWESKPMSLLRDATPDNYQRECGICPYKWTCYSSRCIAYRFDGDVLGDDCSCYKIREKKKIH